MRTLKHTVAGEQCLIHVPEVEEDLGGFQDFLARGDEYLSVDTESTGLDLFTKGHQLRLVQVGNSTEAWVLRVDRFADAAREALLSRRNWVAHNAPYDALVVDRHLGVPLETFLPRVWDTKIMAHIMDPREKKEGGVGLGLKPLSAKFVDPDAPDTAGDLTKVFNSFKWTKQSGWARISLEHMTFLLYAGLDTIIDHRLFYKLLPVVQNVPDLAKFEHKLQYLLTLLQRKGMRLDIPYIERLIIEFHNEYVEQCDLAAEFGLENVNSNDQIVTQLLAMGEVLTEKTTKTGMFKSDAAVLTILADLNREWKRVGAREPNMLADAILRAKRAKHWMTAYAEAFLQLRDENDRLHASINSLQARTARMCLPESEMLLTRRGTLHASEIRVGDETIDAAGDWVPVTAVYRYPQQEVVEYRANVQQKPGRYALRSTREHRWLQRSPRGRVFVEPINTSRPTVLLAPPEQDVFGTTFIAATFGEQFASLVGLLATDGRLYRPITGLEQGMRALVYQTERKFYTQAKALIPEDWLSYDRITDGKDHHEMSIRTRSIRPYLEECGLLPDPECTLKDHPGLIDWVKSLPINEVAAFFRAVFMADGSVASGNKVISVKPPILTEAIRLAAYRLGWLSTVQFSAPSAWSNGPRQFLSFRQAALLLRERTETVTVEDVWCVATATGTFTAKGDLGFYLTGNSIGRPPLQQLPSSDWRVRRCFIPDPGYVMISADYQAVEMRVLAALSGDWTMKRAIRDGVDLHTFTAAAVAGIPMEAFAARLKAEDKAAIKLRKVAKSVGFGKVYGGGADTISRQTGADHESIKVALAAYDATYPGIRRYSQQLIKNAKAGVLEVTTPIGRRLPLDEDRLYAATNYMVQSTARDLLARAIIKLFEAGLGDYLLLPVHDELLGQAPAGDAEAIVKEIGSVMECTFQGVEIASKAEVLGPSWGAGYGAPDVLPLEMPVRKERKMREGQWLQDGLDLGI